MNTNKTLLLISVAVILLLNSAKSAEFEGLIPKWQTRLTENFFEYRPLEYSGCVADSEYQRVFLTNRNGEIISLSSANGEVQWRFSLKHPIHLRPELKNGTLFAASTGGEITALDVSKKYPSLIWKKEIPGGIISDITLSHSEVILLTERNTLYSISAKDGSVIFQVNNDLPEGFTVYTNTPVIVSGEKIIYTLSTGELYILNRADGKLISKVSIYSPDDRIDGFTGLEADENSILLSTQSGLFYRIETKSGKIIWSRTLSQIARIARDRESANIYVFHSDGTISI
ncbi:MAG: PQQ-like beta-propeller repeat protein, partial [Deltaproteobacteria bacterium]|nr:PQQ-like beta-propeller repeat protein [Deltaproteobacteria bacterium]